jgi:hypothetical protein
MNNMKLNLVYLLLFLIAFPSGCSNKEQSRYFIVPANVSKISITGRELQKLFSTSNAGLISVELVDSKSINTFVKTLEKAEFSSGSQMRKRTNLQFTLHYNGDGHQVFDFLFRPNMKTASFTSESNETFILKEKDVLTIAEIFKL